MFSNPFDTSSSSAAETTSKRGRSGEPRRHKRGRDDKSTSDENKENRRSLRIQQQATDKLRPGLGTPKRQRRATPRPVASTPHTPIGGSHGSILSSVAPHFSASPLIRTANNKIDTFITNNRYITRVPGKPGEFIFSTADSIGDAAEQHCAKYILKNTGLKPIFTSRDSVDALYYVKNAVELAKLYKIINPGVGVPIRADAYPCLIAIEIKANDAQLKPAQRKPDAYIHAPIKKLLRDGDTRNWDEKQLAAIYAEGYPTGLIASDLLALEKTGYIARLRYPTYDSCATTAVPVTIEFSNWGKNDGSNRRSGLPRAAVIKNAFSLRPYAAAKKIGEAAENMAIAHIRRHYGYKYLGHLQNASGNGIDAIFYSPRHAKLVIVEVKSSTTPHTPSAKQLSTQQRRRHAHVKDIVEQAENDPRYNTMTPGSRAMPARIKDLIDTAMFMGMAVKLPKPGNKGTVIFKEFAWETPRKSAGTRAAISSSRDSKRTSSSQKLDFVDSTLDASGDGTLKVSFWHDDDAPLAPFLGGTKTSVTSPLSSPASSSSSSASLSKSDMSDDSFSSDTDEDKVPGLSPF